MVHSPVPPARGIYRVTLSWTPPLVNQGPRRRYRTAGLLPRLLFTRVSQKRLCLFIGTPLDERWTGAESIADAAFLTRTNIATRSQSLCSLPSSYLVFSPTSQRYNPVAVARCAFETNRHVLVENQRVPVSFLFTLKTRRSQFLNGRSQMMATPHRNCSTFGKSNVQDVAPGHNSRLQTVRNPSCLS